MQLVGDSSLSQKMCVSVGFTFVVYSLLYHSKQTSKQNKTLRSFSTEMSVLFLTSCLFYPVKLAKANQLVQSYQPVLIEI